MVCVDLRSMGRPGRRRPPGSQRAAVLRTHRWRLRGAGPQAFMALGPVPGTGHFGQGDGVGILGGFGDLVAVVEESTRPGRAQSDIGPVCRFAVLALAHLWYHWLDLGRLSGHAIRMAAVYGLVARGLG